MAYMKTVTAGQSFNNQDNSTLALPPPGRLSSLARVDSERRVNNQVRMMMQNKKNHQSTIKREGSNGQKDVVDLGNRMQSITVKSQGTLRQKTSPYDGTMNGFPKVEDNHLYGTGITRGKRHKSVFSSYSVKGTRSISAPSYRKYSGPYSPQSDNDVFLYGISSSRSEPDLINVGTSATIKRKKSNRRASAQTRSYFMRTTKTMPSRILSDTRSPENVRLVRSCTQLQPPKRDGTRRKVDGVREISGDFNLQKAVALLSTQDPNVQAYASSYIQNECYKEDSAKAMICHLGAIPELINLLKIKNTNVQQSACAALRNAVFKNVTNKLEVKKHDGIKQALQLLRETTDPETKKQITGLLWNLSSCDAIKDDLIKDALPVLTDSVIVPYASQGVKNQGTMDSEIFYNASGCLRNLSSAGQSGRQEMRNTPGFIDALMSHVQGCLAVDQPDEKSVENCVCILHNLSYHLDSEVPSAFAHFGEQADVHLTKKMSKRSSVGCFTPGAEHFEEADLCNMYFTQEDANPRGVNNLFHSKAVKMYASLLDKSKSDATLEASAGALQNLTAGNKVSSYLMSSALVDGEKASPQVAKLLHSGNTDLQKTAVLLLNNLTRHSNLQPQLASQTLPALARLLPSGGKSTAPSDDTIASACNIMRNLIPNNTSLAKTVLQGSMLRNLMNLSKSSTHPSAGKAACLFLYEMWLQKDLQSFFKREGFSKRDFVNDLTSSAVKLAQQNALGFMSKRF
ncbi:plakophilin-1-like [Hypanus sabinus]|uniref:plakophilin-1-like n=1 Tax=Hypanus sabinus TaxID=79690 RepID=UPI0028C48946|nr:plakophilin-1-like [Hypanus sabinus]